MLFYVERFEFCHNSSGQKINEMWAAGDTGGGTERCCSLEIIIPCQSVADYSLCSLMDIHSFIHRRL
jgi:hypothetical protein